MIHVEAKKTRRLTLEVFLYWTGYTTARKRSIAITTMLRVETDSDVSPRKLHILHKNVPPFPWTRKAPDPLISFVMKRGSKKTAVRRSDAAMLAIASRTFSFILTNAVIRREFPIKDANSVKMCIVAVSWLRSVLKQCSGAGVLMFLWLVSRTLLKDAFPMAAILSTKDRKQCGKLDYNLRTNQCGRVIHQSANLRVQLHSL